MNLWFDRWLPQPLKHLQPHAQESCHTGYAILSAYPGQARAVKGFEEVGEKNIDYGWRAVRSERYTYVINRGYRLDYGVERLLYDNIADPYQLNPVKID